MNSQNLETKLEVLHLLLLQEGIDEVLDSKDPKIIKLLKEEFDGKSVRDHIMELSGKNESEYLDLVTKIRDFFLD